MKSVFSGERIYLKLLTEEDITDNVMSWFNDPVLMQYYTDSKSEITKAKLLESIKKGQENKNNYTYGIYYTENDELIGTVKLGPINHVHKISDLATLIGNANYHHRGLAVEAIKVGNQIAFEQFGIRKLFSGMYESNISSIKAYTHANWVIEGRLKGQFLVNGKTEDKILVACFNPKYFEDA
ncbi:MAG: GNAT family protein [Saprospiraceae bacterium]